MTPEAISPEVNLDELLAQARAINPRIQFVKQDTFAGDWHRKIEFWAQIVGGPHSRAFCGDTPELLLQDIRDTSEAA